MKQLARQTGSKARGPRVKPRKEEIPVSNPRRRTSGLMVREVEGEVLILDTESDQVHQLNSTASYIWNRCDGATSAEEIAKGLANEFEAGDDKHLQDVLDTVETLKGRKLLEEA